MKLKWLVIFLLLSLTIVMFYYNGVLPKALSVLLGYPDYLIITGDEYYNSTSLQQFVNWKLKQGFKVEVKKISEIYSKYPIPAPTVTFLKAKNITDIQSDFVRVYALWFDDVAKKYVIWAYHGYGTTPEGKRPFRVVNPPSEPKEVYLYIQGEGSKTITLNYDGKILNVTIIGLTYGYTYWGKPLVTVDGHLYFNATQSYSVLEYIKSYQASVSHVLLIGNVSTVPSFDFRYIDSASELIFTGFTDYPYSILDLDDKYMTSRINVGRFPVNNIRELDTVIRKTMNYKPFMSDKSVFIKGPPLFVSEDTWNEQYTKMRDSVNNSLLQIRPGTHNYELIEPEKTVCITNINSENNYLIFFAHGGSKAIMISSGSALTVDDVISNVNFYNSTVTVMLSCFTNDLSSYSIGRAFLLDQDSETTIVLGPTLPAILSSSKDLLRCFFYELMIEKSAGESLKEAKNLSFTINYYLNYEKLNWNMLGDPSLNLVEETVQKVSYGWLDLSYTVNGIAGTLDVSYAITFPNSTIKTYTGTRITVNNLPVGSYSVTCTYKNMSQSQTVEVKENQGTTVVFNFEEIIQPKVGTIRVYSNVDVVVQVTGPVNITRTTPFVLSNVPVGTYTLKAVYQDVVKTATITLGEGQDISYTFEFEVYTPITNYFEIVRQYLPFIFIGLVVVVVIRWR